MQVLMNKILEGIFMLYEYIFAQIFISTYKRTLVAVKAAKMAVILGLGGSEGLAGLATLFSNLQQFQLYKINQEK
jgi:hypothetical protein